MIWLTVPLRTSNPLNGSHGHWSKVAKLRKEQRGVARLAVLSQFVVHGHRPGLPAIVTMTRLAPSSGLDFDGLTASLKSVRDGIADALGLKDDNDPRVTWKYDQVRSKTYGVRISMQNGA